MNEKVIQHIVVNFRIYWIINLVCYFAFVRIIFLMIDDKLFKALVLLRNSVHKVEYAFTIGGFENWY